MDIFQPIYKDTYYQVPASASPFEYSIYVLENTYWLWLNILPPYSYVLDRGREIFKGKAWVSPTAATIDININQIAQDYLTQTIIPFSDIDAVVDERGQHSVTISGGVVTPRKTFLLTSGGDVRACWNLYYDWSYRDDIPYTSGGYHRVISQPINGHGTCGMYYFTTFILEEVSNGQDNFRIINNGCRVCGGYLRDYVNGPWSIVYPEIYGGGSGPWHDGYCGHYALYYLNRYGGYDSFLCEGNCKRKDGYKRSVVRTPHDNNNVLDWGKKVYQNEITPAWELNSGFLGDAESERLAFNLLSSNEIYVHDLDRDEIYPAIITDTQTDYKHHNRGQGMTNYTINLEASQTQLNLR